MPSEPASPYEWGRPEPTPKAQAFGEQLMKAAFKQMQDRAAAIESVGWAALQDGHGVRVDDYTDGTWIVQLDRTTHHQITEYRHGHAMTETPTYRCLNCESRDAMG